MGAMNILTKIFRFYYEGFRSMTLGKTLWVIILIKLFIMFVLFRLFLFPDFLNERCDSDQEKSDFVIEQLHKKQY